MKYAWLLLLVGCDLDNRSKWPPHNAVTQDGYRAFLPDGLSVDRDLVLVWIDVRVADWIESRKGEYPLEGLYHLAQTTTYWVVDDYRFPTAGSYTGYAVGDINSWSKHPVLRCCIYTQSSGQLPSDGMGVIVIGHELDHRLGISH